VAGVSELQVGMRVHKIKGDYAFDGTVVALFEKLDGTERVVVESQLIPGLLHIFAPHQMMSALLPPSGPA
jgi:hypothetical protein